MYSIGKFAKKVGVTIQTLRDWNKSGKLKPEFRSKGEHRYYSDNQLNEIKNNGECKLKKATKQNFIQIPFIKLLAYIEEKAQENRIETIRVNESYTSKTSCISGDVCDVQEYSNALKTEREESACTFKAKYNGKRTKRGLFKDIIIKRYLMPI